MTISNQKELFKSLIEHHSWRQEVESFSKLIGPAIWLVIPNPDNNNFDYRNYTLGNKEAAKTHARTINELIPKARKTRRPQKLTLANGKYVYCVPISRSGQMYCYLCLLNLKNQIAPDLLGMLYYFTCTTIESIQKDIELSKLYDTIRPKTIALSTVHTISRIIGSTLEINELLPRIARLTLQVLRARRCSIMLLDKQKKFLIPHATVDLANKSARQSSLRVGTGVPGHVVKSGKTIVRPQYMCVPLVAEEYIIGTISVSYRLDNKPFGIFDREILTTLAEQSVIAIKNAQLYDEQEKLTLNSIQALASILSSGAAEHFGRTSIFINLSMSIGMELKLRSDQMRILYYSSLLHNVSQMGMPQKILRKTTKLTGKDYKIIREQHLKGTQVIRPIGGRLKAVLPIIIYHHERYDGKGYPSGLRADDIPLGSRILAVADAFEAMLSKRPYRRKMSIAQAVSEIVKCSGEQFDPVIVDAFVRVIKRSRNKIFQGEKNAWVWKRF